MPQERTSPGAHKLALGLALLVHAVAALVLLASVERQAPAAATGALQVTWVDPAPPVQAEDAAMPAPGPVLPEATTTPRPARAPPDAVPDPAPTPPPPEPSRLLSAVFIEQGKALARVQGGAGFTRNPLFDRAPTLDAPAERIRMREPMSPARVVEGIGKLLGGADYETSPCPRIRRNIAALGPGGDGAALQEEVRCHQRFCE